MTDPDRPKKPRPTFEAAVEALCLKYGYSDWAIIARADSRAAKGWWVAGDGKDPVDDHERALLLYARMGVLQETITTHLKTPPAI